MIKYTEELHKHYKSFEDFILFPPFHSDLEHTTCSYAMEINCITDIKRPFGDYREIVVHCYCPVHNDIGYRYRATIRLIGVIHRKYTFTKKKKVLVSK